MKLLIAIPALNEEESIASIVERCLEARPAIVGHGGVTAVDVTVVSDGSTDRTVERARAFGDRINLIVFPKNRGYGAAIKEAWRQSDAELLGFLDADGTCDPLFFATLCRTAASEGADVVLGCRLNQNSQMPLVRRVGNTLFAVLLNFVASERVRDTASGMRVVRRQSLRDIYPLPDGLHFTPAMSARAILSRRIRIVEVDMPYSERSGESKLRVIKDGLRFLRVIIQTALLYRPARLMNACGLAAILVALALMTGPTIYYLQHRAVAEWMIYRFVVSHMMATAGALLMSIGFLSTRMVGIALSGEAFERREAGHRRLLYGLPFWGSIAVLSGVAALLVARGFVQLATTGNVYEHWSRFIVMSGCLQLVIMLVVTRIADHVLTLVGDRLAYLQLAPDEAPAGELVHRQ
jgi:glycosyltransferase involved in cell wall biosynthesis